MVAGQCLPGGQGTLAIAGTKPGFGQLALTVLGGLEDTLLNGDGQQLSRAGGRACRQVQLDALLQVITSG